MEKTKYYVIKIGDFYLKSSSTISQDISLTKDFRKTHWATSVEQCQTKIRVDKIENARIVELEFIEKELD